MARLVALSLAALLPQALAQCSWPGHCSGDSCTTWDDCADDLVCVAGKCSVESTEQTCSWVGHCVGAACAAHDDCSDDLYCNPTDGICEVADTDVSPFTVTVGCWEYAHQVPAGDSCASQPGPDPCADVTITDLLLEVSGEHFNIGTGNIEITVKTIGSSYNTWGPGAVDGVAVDGLAGGSFVKDVMALCPRDASQAVEVTVTDLDSGVTVMETYP